MTQFYVGPLKLSLQGSFNAQVKPIGSTDVKDAVQHVAFCTGPDDIAFECAYTVFNDFNAGDVRVLNILDTPSPYSRLAQGGRLGIASLGDRNYCELRAMKFTSENWSNLHRASLKEMNDWLEEDVNKLLQSHGASPIGTRAAIFGDSGPRRDDLAVAFDQNNILVPLVAYVLTRPLPLLKGIRNVR